MLEDAQEQHRAAIKHADQLHSQLQTAVQQYTAAQQQLQDDHAVREAAEACAAARIEALQQELTTSSAELAQSRDMITKSNTAAADLQVYDALGASTS